MRFVSAQLEAYLADGLWLKLARHANAMAQRLAQGLGATLPRLPGARLLHPVEANELFVQLPASAIAGLRQAGFEFYDWPAEEGAGDPPGDGLQHRGGPCRAILEGCQRLGQPGGIGTELLREDNIPFEIKS